MLDVRRQKLALGALAEGLTNKEAADAAGITTAELRAYRARDEVFNKMCADAFEDGTDVLEAESFRRAVRGVERTKFWQGVPIGVEQEYSDTLLLAMLKGRRPERYKERVQQEWAGVGGNPIEVAVIRRVIVDPAKE